MTEAELLSVAQKAWSNNPALTAIYLSVVTGYLVVAYSAGNKLTSSQALIINGFSIVVCVFLVVAMHGFSQYAIEAELEALKTSSWRTSPVYGFIPVLLQAFAVLIVLMSLKFMRDVRHSIE